MSCRLAVLGGSAVSTVQLIDALADWPGGPARRPDGLELVLHGRSWRLEAVAGRLPDASRHRGPAGQRSATATLPSATLGSALQAAERTQWLIDQEVTPC
jgi:hypothetical protein